MRHSLTPLMPMPAVYPMGRPSRLATGRTIGHPLPTILERRLAKPMHSTVCRDAAPSTPHVLISLPIFSSIFSSIYTAWSARSPLLTALLITAAALCPIAPPASAAPAAAASVFAGMDRAVSPGNDFYAYVNGGWLADTDIPADRGSWSVGQVLSEQTNKQVVELIQHAAEVSPASPDAQRVGHFFNAFMDEAGIDARGLAPLQPELTRIAGLTDKKSLARLLGSRLRSDVDALNSTNFHTENLFGLWVVQGLHDPARYQPYLLQGGLGMPDRDYYLSATPKMAELRVKYQAYVATVLRLAGASDAEARAERVMGLEMRLAASHASRQDSADIQKADNLWRRADFARLAAGMDWAAYFGGAGLSAQPRFIVWHPGAVKGEAAQVAATDLDVWKDYLRFHSINHAAQVLPHVYGDAHFAFFGTALAGTPQQELRWKRAVTATNGALGYAVGHLYTDRYFPAAAKAKAQGMVANIVQAFGNRIERLDWMAPATKARAQAKLKATYVGVGYPDRWRDYSGLVIDAGDALGNQQRAESFNTRRDIARLGKPVDHTEWQMVPQVVNAVNLPLQNAMNFPAAILQPPFFDPAASDARNYGAIGAIIGHEISHSFDDQGAQFDARGRLQNWWTKDDLAHFQSSSAALAAQYSTYHPFPDLAVNGQQTLSENIADLAGLLAAYDAFRASIGRQPAGAADADDQEFFIAYGMAWRGKAREPSMRRQIATDGHAPGRYRVATVRNLDAWYRSFEVQPAQSLYLAPASRVRLW